MIKDIRIQAFLDAGMTYEQAVAATVASVEIGDSDGAKLFAEVAQERLRRGEAPKNKDS